MYNTDEAQVAICRSFLEKAGIILGSKDSENETEAVVGIYQEFGLSKADRVPYPARADVEKSDENSIRLMPRINALTQALGFCGAEEVQEFYEGIPYVLVVDDETAFVCCYEEISDNEYLLHFRADVPVDDMETDGLKEKAEAFNENHFFAKCYLDQEDLGIFEDDPGKIVTFHAVIPDYGAIKTPDFYGFFAGLFQADIMDFRRSQPFLYLQTGQ